MDNTIQISKHICFDTESGRFHLTSNAQEIIYRKKELICSYSGSNEWANHFVCEMIDFCSGSSIYNYALGTTQHEKRIPEILKINKEGLIDWIIKSKEKPWGKVMYEFIDRLIDEAAPND